MNVLVIGSGGREHALCWRLKQSALVKKIYCAPGNPGIAQIAENVDIKVTDLQGLCNFALEKKIELTVVGPELPLSLGVVDIFRAKGLKIFGPSKAAAQLEASKSFAKEVMTAAGVPTAAYASFSEESELRKYLENKEAPLVLKADGLAAGKGVFVCQNRDEVQAALPELYGKMKASKVVVEDYLVGDEVSFIIATDGKRVYPFASSHDYKRIFDGQQGPNTGGMGSVSPSPYLPAEMEPWVVDNIIRPVLKEMAERDAHFSGFLYAGLMISRRADSSWKINVLEFNARMGDPECQVIMRRMDADLAEVLLELCSAESAARSVENSGKLQPKWSRDSAVCVVLAAEGYPQDVTTGDEICGISEAEALKGAVVFHSGTTLDSSARLLTAGGRVLGVSASAATLSEARQKAYQASEKITFRGRQNRKDIGL